MKSLKRWVSVLLSLATVVVCMASCSQKSEEPNDVVSLDNKEFLDSLSSGMYAELANALDSDEYRVDSVEAVYISKEYIEEIEYNSKSNVYFGHTIAELDELFGDKKYVFTLGEDGNTVVNEFEEQTSSISKTLKKIAVGTGVVLICVAVTVITIKTGPAVAKAFLAISPKALGTTSTMMISQKTLTDGLSILGAGVVEGVQTKDFGKALNAMKDEALEEFAIEAVAGFIGK